MTPPGYSGPMSLAYSRYASPSLKPTQPATIPAAVSSTKTGSANTIATKEQIAATHEESAYHIATGHTSAELAVTQGNALKDEVEKHATKFSSTVSSAVTNTRRLLELIREAVQKEDPASLKTVDDLWTELQQLFEAAKGAKDALPDFLEKQRNNMALYHGSVMNETYRESQEELNLQHKKTNLQHGLILEQQQAFQDYKAQTASKLKELEELHERVSRLTLEKGNFRDEIAKYAQLLDREKSNKAEHLKKADALRVELDVLTDSKKQLLAEVEGLQKTVSDLQEKMKTTEQEITDRFTAELKEKTELLVKEATKAANLNTFIQNLKGQESSGKLEISKTKAENKQLQEKYSRMVAEHTQAFSKANEQTNKIESLSNDAARLRKESAEMKERLSKVAELQQVNAILFKDKSSLLEQVGKLSMELKTVKDSCVKVKEELEILTDELNEAQKDNIDLRSENGKLVAKQTAVSADTERAKQAIQAAFVLKNENAQLKTTIEKLKDNQAAPVVGGTPASSEEVVDYEVKVQTLEEQKADLQSALDEWTTLAKRTYKEYKEILPTYKRAEQFRQTAEQQTEAIKGLQAELSEAKVAQSNDVGAGGDAAYWKGKYDNLLASIGN